MIGRSETSLLESRRREFCIDLMLTLSCAATLLVATLVGLEAQDVANTQIAGIRLGSESAGNSTYLQAASRETRSTTRRRPQSSASSTSSSTTMASPTSGTTTTTNGTEASTLQTTETAATGTTPTTPATPTKAAAAGASSTKATASDERELSEAEYDEEIARLERERKRRQKLRHRKEGTQPASSTTTTTSTTAKPVSTSAAPKVSSSTAAVDDYEYESEYEDSDPHNGRSLGPLLRNRPHKNHTTSAHTSARPTASSSPKPVPPSVKTTASPPHSSSSSSASPHVVAPHANVTTAEPSTTTPKAMIVQVLNQTEAISHPMNSTASNATANEKQLDWSKLVKVVFKSAGDNQTKYTLVMNSSELSQHPISDWSHELPNLLQRDFERLIRKWSGVFPMDHIMLDLNQILATKLPINITTAAPPKLAATTGVATPNETQPASASNSSFLPLGLATTPPPMATTSATPNVSSSLFPSAPPVGSFNATVPSNATTSSTTPPTTNITTASPIASAPVQTTNLTLRPTPATAPPVESLALNKTIRPRPSLQEAKIVPEDKMQQPISEIIRDLRNENHKIEDDVKGSLRHFIIVCSIAVVVATSMIVALIVVFFK